MSDTAVVVVVVHAGYKECDGHIRDYKDNKLRLLPGCTPEESLEVRA
jgi:hypothetical protein